MGLSRRVLFPGGALPAWADVRANLTRAGVDAVPRMIDGLPAFPDEVPEPGWKELRVGVGPGMVTVRVGLGEMTCLVWGNADAALLAARDAVCWACAAAGGGSVETDAGPLPAGDFARSAGLPAS